MAGIPAGTLSIQIVAEIARLQNDLDKAKRAVASASGDIAKSARHANDNLAGMGKGAAAMGQGTRLAGHHVQNLTFQLNDMFVGLASGQKPMTVFMQQGAQIGQIMQMAGVGLAGFVKELALMLVPFSPIIAALGAMGIGLAMVTGQINENSKVHVTWMDVVLGTYDAVVASIKAGLTGAIKGYGITSSEVFKSVWEYAKTAFNAIYGIGTLVPRTLAQAWSTLPQAVGEAAVAAANAAIRAMNGLMKAAVDGVNAYVSKINAAIAAVNNITGSSFGMLPTLTAPQINQVANQFTGAGVKFGAAMGKAVTDTFSRDYIGEGAKFVQPFAEARARKRLAEVGGKGGKDAGAAAGKAAGEELAKSEEIAKAMEKLLFQATMDAVKAASALLAENQAKDWEAFTKAINDNLDGAQKPILDAAAAQADWNDELRATVDYLTSIGGKAGDMGSFFSALTSGDWSNLSGKTGALLKTLGGISWQGTTTVDGREERITRLLSAELRDVFSKDGTFGETLKAAFDGLGTGAAVGGIMFGGNKTAQMGSMFGGAAGQALGEAASGMLGKLGAAAGPLGAIAGSLLGGVLGGLLTTVKKASATIGVANGQLGVSGVSGNSNSRKAASTQGAGTVIDALNQIADAFGATLGSAGVSIGMRNNSYRVDTTGAGRTKGAGVLNFGKDSEAALKAAIADAISDGVFVGLSEGVERLLKNGDVEKQLQKALSFQAVFDDLAASQDPAKAAADAITKWHDSMAKIFAEAGATAEELAKLETLTGIKRAEAAEAAAQALLEKERPYREANILIMQLEGKVTEALAAQRQLELDGMEEGLRPLYQRIHALQDEAETAAKLAELTAQRHELETQLLEILDPVAGARAREADALAALDPSLRTLMQSIWDAKTASEAAATALAEQQRVAQEVADERAGLETTWLQLIGDTNGLRARERAGISETNRALYDQIIAEQDRLAAVEAATKAIQDAAEALKTVMAVVDQRRDMTIELAKLLDPAAAQVLERADALRGLDPSLRDLQQTIWSVTDGIDAAAKAAQELKDATEAAAALMGQRRGLTIELAEALGDTAAAEAMRRADTLNGLDPSLRGLQEQVWAATDAANAAKAAEEELARQREEQARRQAEAADAWAAAEEARLQRIADARNVLIGAYDRESGALQGTIDKFRGFADSIREFRDGLMGQANPGASYGRTLAQFKSTSAMAGLGSADALGRFNGDAQALLDAAKEQAGSAAEYRRILATVMGGANGAIGGATGVANMAQQQLDSMKAQVGALVGINEKTETLVSVSEAIAAYQAATAEQVPVLVDTVSYGLQTVEAAVTTQTQQQASTGASQQTVLETMAVNIARLQLRFDAAFQDGALRIASDEVLNVNVTNAPLSVDQV